MKVNKVMTPDEFKEKMNLIVSKKNIESGHVEMDSLMCDLLITLGYGEGVKIFDSVEKWYA